MQPAIREVRLEDSRDLLAVYAPYVENTCVTFETLVPSEEEFRRRIELFRFSLGFPYFTAELNGELVGYAYSHPFHERSAYRFTAETSVYVRQGGGQKGVGSALYSELLTALKLRGIHTAMAILCYPNEASKRFHEKFGFREAGHFHEVGFKFGQWLDVGYLEKTL